MKFNDCYIEWLRAKEMFKVRFSTIRMYDSIFKTNFLTDFGTMQLSSVTDSLIRIKAGTLLNSCQPKYAMLCLSLLGNMFEFAVSEGYVDHNPCTKILYKLRKQRTEKKEVYVFSPEEIAKIKNYFLAKPLDQCVLVHILCDTGMRIGEALPLTPADINFTDKKILVNKTIYRGVLRQYTKTGNNRAVLIPDSLLPILSRWTQSSVSLPSNTEIVRGFFNKALRELDIPRRKIHSLRASYVTNSLRKGLPPLFVAQNVGDTLQTILNNYVGVADIQLTEKESEAFNG